MRLAASACQPRNIFSISKSTERTLVHCIKKRSKNALRRYENHGFRRETNPEEELGAGPSRLTNSAFEIPF